MEVSDDHTMDRKAKTYRKFGATARISTGVLAAWGQGSHVRSAGDQII
jgi:hypothetical protein